MCTKKNNSGSISLQYNRELKSVRWHKIKAKKDPNEICNTIIDVFNHIKKLCTIEEPRSGNDCKTDKPWITAKIKQCMIVRDEYFRKHKSNKLYEELYKKHRNIVVNLIKKQKLNYEKNIFMQCKGDPKKI
jgi:hypothetical protein